LSLQELVVDASEVLLVKGPASVSSASADAHALGMKMYGREVLVWEGKVLPFECFTKATFVAHLGRGGEERLDYT
jgi:hypothetical protein